MAKFAVILESDAPAATNAERAPSHYENEGQLILTELMVAGIDGNVAKITVNNGETIKGLKRGITTAAKRANVTEQRFTLNVWNDADNADVFYVRANRVTEAQEVGEDTAEDVTETPKAKRTKKTA